MLLRFMVMRGEKAAAAPVNASIFPPYCRRSVELAQMGEGLFLQENAAHLNGFCRAFDRLARLLLVQHLVAQHRRPFRVPRLPDLVLRLSNKKR